MEEGWRDRGRLGGGWMGGALDGEGVGERGEELALDGRMGLHGVMGRKREEEE